MKALLLNGAHPGDSLLQEALEQIADQLEGAAWDVTTFTLHSLPLEHCTGCLECWVKTPGVCRTDDVGWQIADSYVGADLAVMLTPVTFGGYGSQLKAALDRLIGIVHPSFVVRRGFHVPGPRYERYPRLIVVGSMPHEELEARYIFEGVVSRTAANFHSPAHAAGVLTPSSSAEQCGQFITSLLDAVGVTQ